MYFFSLLGTKDKITMMKQSFPLLHHDDLVLFLPLFKVLN